MTTDDVARLQRDVRYLMDRGEILDCVARHSRGCDRHDSDLLCGTYHDDGIDEHGTSTNKGPDYANWANAAHAATSLAHTHNITTHTCEIDGDTAHCESYVLVGLLLNDGVTVQLLNGRYLDRLERRDGRWRIAVRRSTVEWSAKADASMLQSRFFTEKAFLRGTRAKDDLSYQRPLRIDTPAPARW
ncbi:MULTISPECIES: nuclear transport factor 2 family protein [Rhodococcus]|uniref:Nuclear transport factor 2 family protein n=1 Tax=Rhodococcus oxybenzonivorans TaxID=1990687 RepID=A0AAE4V2P2_9NOCA|nr:MULTISPECIES: nuclear transport factor 2 family protein [Rhodococcus]MDV7240999.1 nuclear transport factor 2 family protein [Rhodococcus oxybenzonivorans]MDV7267791.1 nuclear transport factor 2 family protein [Rhodococcus oxybenzonivorans]MDV7273272.1 nuclear transport factor 2 family protein [Rhodococcus oxybenzonivorans]MDV7332990.1 nuclear transport factor 2 family protein [Rhodococcus oxybenzonivorans]MDV7342156.1 nuclear transport factor 2 family protein [Rhodococcus oxybenzonivorans]